MGKLLLFRLCQIAMLDEEVSAFHVGQLLDVAGEVSVYPDFACRQQVEFRFPAVRGRQVARSIPDRSSGALSFQVSRSRELKIADSETGR
ncbi:hypothetical protein QZM52_02400 [Burkholderia metallica]|uniref:Uncharacterized protein n=1 Tax=Burkholderia metallica TaxID=488729 RepID=A0ABT8P5M1_9BURK|nr:hypothetical protein [Burkholderia metallica]MDN7930137.1 hypothetical protein [Burkholderia metallica]